MNFDLAVTGLGISIARRLSCSMEITYASPGDGEFPPVAVDLGLKTNLVIPASIKGRLSGV